jgi:5S rRNA maturation endonuclease (ribonuclease M5)
MVSDDGESAMCMRDSSGSPFQMRSGDTAYIHRITDKPRKSSAIVQRIQAPIKKPDVDWNALHLFRLSKTSKQMIEKLAAGLGVSEYSLLGGTGVGAAWFPEHSAWGFPMRDGNYKVIGIRLRNDSGKKWAIKGSSGGLFYSLMEPQKTIVVCEGPTDTAAAISCGLFAIGRPSCSSGAKEIVEFIGRNKEVKEVVIVSDKDYAGVKGASSLSSMLPVRNVVVTLPCKDMRQFYNDGGSAEMLSRFVRSMVWVIPRR